MLLITVFIVCLFGFIIIIIMYLFKTIISYVFMMFKVKKISFLVLLLLRR